MNWDSAFACDQESQFLAAPHGARPAPGTALVRKLEVRWASCEADVRQAQRLRYLVFAQEMGARIAPPAGTAAGLEADRFDPFCDHLLVTATTGDGTSLLAGTYRVLPPGAAQRAGGLYIDTEFDLAPLASLRSKAVELGRSCVHPAWRSGGVIMALWTALGQYMLVRGLDTMIGCASVSLGQGRGQGHGGQTAENLWSSLRHTHLVDQQWQIRPLYPLPLNALASAGDARGQKGNTPPLIKGYLRCGARLLGPPALDVAFNTADLPMLLRTDDLHPGYRKHFMGAR